MKRKGFLFTILTFLLLISIFLLASYFYLQKPQIDIHQEKMRNIFDNIRSNVLEIISLSADVNTSGGTTIVTFNDNLPLQNGTSTINRYKSFIEGIYANETNTNITLVDITDSKFRILPYSLIYDYPNFDKREIRIYDESGNADIILLYDIGLKSNESLINITSEIISGDLGIVINVKFANATYNFSGGISRTDNSTWIFNLANSKITIRIGNNSIDTSDRYSSMVVSLTGNSTANLITKVLFMSMEIPSIRSNIHLSVENDIKGGDYLWIVPQSKISTSLITTTTTLITTTTTSTTTTTATTSITTTSTTTTTTSTTITSITTTTTTTTIPETTTTTTSTTTSTTTTSTTTTTTTISTCNSYCMSLDYTSGTCRANQQQCNNNGEIYESGGDIYCTGGPSVDTCCCRL